LRIRAEGPAYIRTLLPLQTEPMQIFDHGFDKMWPRAFRVQILVAEDQRACGVKRALLCHPEGARVAKVQVSGGRRSQPAAVRTRQNKSGILEKAMRVGAAAPARSMLAKQSLLVPYL
jgi:hypothetical protein